ncbi:hypothetical protein [Photobacterium phosphoreum]|jgi:hypothetical protein|uniref:hypothetical protein n=1 Tax=Photobacterium phosphoreum TaxID=659 RepID=UPI0024B6CA38|nr:hypothetical protein [Photobacterium phosphoreum]
MGINEFFEKVLGQKLPNQYSWGCYVPVRSAMCWTIWQEEIKNNRVEVHSDTPYRTKAGHVNRNWTNRKDELKRIKSGVPAYGVMISCGKTFEEESWSIQALNSHEIFKLSDLQFNPSTNKWTMAIDKTQSIPVEAIKFDKVSAVTTIMNFSQAYKTYKKAENFGWKLIGLSEQVASLSLNDKVIDITLIDGSYTRK